MAKLLTKYSDDGCILNQFALKAHATVPTWRFYDGAIAHTGPVWVNSKPGLFYVGKIDMGMHQKGVDPTSGSGETQILSTFATPLVTAQLPKCESLNQQLRDLFVERAAQGERYSNPEPRVKRNKTLFESRFNLFDWPEPRYSP